MDKEICGRGLRPVLYKTDVLQILLKQVLKAGGVEVFSVGINIDAAM